MKWEEMATRPLRLPPQCGVLGTSLVLAMVAGSLSCVTHEERMRPLENAPAPHIDRLIPSMTVAGSGFQVQPSGDSAVSIIGSDFVSSSLVQLDGQPALTTFGNSTGLTAIVPRELFMREGAVEVTVQNGDGQTSNGVLFAVLPAKGPAPQISRLLPDSCGSGAGFNIQPNGDSAVALEGTDFTPGATIYFDATPLLTTFGDRVTLTATIPRSMLNIPRTFKVCVRNPDGQTSAAVSFTVTRPVK